MIRRYAHQISVQTNDSIVSSPSSMLQRQSGTVASCVRNRSEMFSNDTVCALLCRQWRDLVSFLNISLLQGDTVVACKIRRQRSISERILKNSLASLTSTLADSLVRLPSSSPIMREPFCCTDWRSCERRVARDASHNDHHTAVPPLLDAIPCALALATYLPRTSSALRGAQ